jgi:hypothetical protein
LANTRIGSPTDDNVETLMALYLNSDHFTIQQIQDIEKKTMYVFANKKKMKEYNYERLKEQHSKDNPVARLKVASMSNTITSNKLPRCFKKDN